jgi:hypothetical protein
MTTAIDEVQVERRITLARESGAAFGGAVLATVDEAHRDLHFVKPLPERLRVLLLSLPLAARRARNASKFLPVLVVS